MLALMLYYCGFKILNIFGTKDLPFHFAQGWANYVTGPGLSLTIFILIFNNSQNPQRKITKSSSLQTGIQVSEPEHSVMSTKPASLATLCCPTSSASPDTWSESCGDQRYSQLLPPTPSGRGQAPPGTCLWGQPGVVPFCFRSYSPERTRSSASSQEQGGE